MTGFLGAPIEFNKGLGGYLYNEASGGSFEISGLWFSEKELYALLLIQQLISNIGVGMLKSELYPVEERVKDLLGRGCAYCAPK
ncbi:MAG: hypothetical protein KUG73_04290 [Pseudomonadales bacterium]|nr:hypothetical protein [Pseudomonadales bacterium]